MDVTLGGKYSPAMEIRSKAEANAYFEKCVRHTMSFGKSRDEAELIERDNLGYYAGYYDHDTRIRVETLFQCQHPIFGRASDGEPSAEDAFQMGMKLGEMSKKKGAVKAFGDLKVQIADHKIAEAVERLTREMPVDDILDDIGSEPEP